MDSRLGRLEDLNRSLNPKQELSGVFLPVGSQKRFDVMFLAEMPSMNEPKEKIGKSIPNFGVTARDMFLQEMMTKYGCAGSYVTDIVKTRDVPRRPRPEEVKTWLPFLLQEIEIIHPEAIIVIGKRTYDVSFKPFVEHQIPKGIKTDWVFHYCSQVSRPKFEKRFREVVGKVEKSKR